MSIMKIFVLLNSIIIISRCNEFGYYDDYATEVAKTTTTKSTPTDLAKETQKVLNDDWIAHALKDISYYLRNFKFNEWDRRYYHTKPDNDDLIGYYKFFPKPSLRTMHWKVYDNCYDDFLKCLIYLHSVVETIPFTRIDDIVTLVNYGKILANDSRTEILQENCKKGLLNSEKTAFPFEGPLDRFKWRTSASYYMCWYTMLGIPSLSMIGEKCDNFANCLHSVYGARNGDPRADDKQSFACAMYSFCPDPCCPLKHVKNMAECYTNLSNLCLPENVNGTLLDKKCKFLRSQNQYFHDIIDNKWKINCHCSRKGYVWKSEFNICVDINECTTEKHSCDRETQTCLNLPGNYTCVCKHRYKFKYLLNKCKRKK